MLKLGIGENKGGIMRITDDDHYRLPEETNPKHRLKVNPDKPFTVDASSKDGGSSTETSSRSPLRSLFTVAKAPENETAESVELKQSEVESDVEQEEEVESKGEEEVETTLADNQYNESTIAGIPESNDRVAIQSLIDKYSQAKSDFAAGLISEDEFNAVDADFRAYIAPMISKQRPPDLYK